MIEMNDVILYVLDPGQQVAQDAGVVRNLNSQGVFDCSHGADGMNRSSDAADALCEQPGSARVTSLQDGFNAPKHCA